VVLLDKSPISWKFKKQSMVACSSVEAKYKAIGQAAAQITRLVILLQELGVSKLKPVTLHCDN